MEKLEEWIKKVLRLIPLIEELAIRTASILALIGLLSEMLRG